MLWEIHKYVSAANAVSAKKNVVQAVAASKNYTMSPL